MTVYHLCVPPAYLSILIILYYHNIIYIIIFYIIIIFVLINIKYSYYYVWVNVLCWAKSWTMVIFFSLSNFYLEITTSFSSYIIFHICNTSQTHPNKLWVPSRHSFSTQSDTGNLTPSTFPHLESAFSLNLQNHHPEVSRCCRPRHKSLCLFYVFYFISWIPCFLYHCYCTHLGVTHPLLLKNST